MSDTAPSPKVIQLTDELFEAVKKDDGAEITRLAAAGASLIAFNKGTREGAFNDGEDPALVRAAAEGKMSALKALIEAGADPAAVGLDGVPAIIWAVRLNQIEALRYLLTVTDPNITTLFQQTALMSAATKAESAPMIELLLPVSDAELKDSEGRTAVDLATQFGRKQNAELIKGAALAINEARVLGQLTQRRADSATAPAPSAPGSKPHSTGSL